MEVKTILASYETVAIDEVSHWFRAGSLRDFPKNGGVCIKYNDLQIAIFSFDRKGEWYACQNLCPHKMEMVLSRGLIGDEEGISKVACPLHKSTFSLKTGENLNGDLPSIATYPVKVEEGIVYVGFKE